MSKLSDILRERSHFIIDLDGVVYHGNQLIDGAADAIRIFRDRGKTIGFLTNNSTKGSREIAQKLNQLGIDCSEREVCTSMDATVDFMSRSEKYKRMSIKVLGSGEFKTKLSKNSLNVVDSEEFECLVVGMDPQFTYETVAKVLNPLIKGCAFIVCNEDGFYPSNGVWMPGCGALVGALRGSSGRIPDEVVGKPNPLFLKNFVDQLDGDLSKTLVIGDSLESDVWMAKSVGVPSIWISEKPCDLDGSFGLKSLIDVANMM